MLLLIRILSIILGVFILLCATTHEQQDKYLQNWIERFWVNLDDRRNLAVSYHTKFMRQIAFITRNGLDRLFGKRLVSIRSVIVSLTLSASAFALSMWIALLVGSHRPDIFFQYISDNSTLRNMNDFNISFYYFVMREVSGFSCWILFLFAVLPVMLDKRWTWLWEVLGVFLWILLFSHLIEVKASYKFAISAIGGLTSSCIFVVVYRKILKSGIYSDNFRYAAILALVNLFLGVSMLLVPHEISLLLNKYSFTTAAVSADFISVFNIFSALLCLFHLLLALTLIFHKSIWPILMRPVYMMQRYEIFHLHKKSAIITGLIILFSGLLGFPGWVWNLLNAF